MIIAAVRVLPTIHFDDELPTKTDEIDDVATNQRLPIEFDTIKAMSTQQIPEPPLGIRHSLTQLLRLSEVHRPSPALASLGHPPPQGGRGSGACGTTF